MENFIFCAVVVFLLIFCPPPKFGEIIKTKNKFTPIDIAHNNAMKVARSS